MTRPVRVLLVSPHPVQYAVPVYRLFEDDPRIDCTVAFCSMEGIGEFRDEHLGQVVQWDIPLLDGYRWVAPKQLRARPTNERFLGLINPGLWKIIRRGRYDVVVSYGYRAVSFWISLLAARASGARFVWTSESTGFQSRGSTSLKQRIKAKVTPAVYGRGDAIFAVSHRTLEWLKGLHLRRPKLFLTPFVVENERFAREAAAVDPVETREAWGVPPDAFVAMFVGKFVAWKRPWDLLEAAAKVPDLWVVLAGSGPMEEDLRRVAERLGIAERTRFLGFVNQSALPATYAASDVLVVPSSFEPFGVVANEAMACGTTVIATDVCGSVGDVVIEGQTGLVMPVADVGFLASALARLKDDPALLRDLSQRASQISERWGPRHHVEAVVTACRDVAGLPAEEEGQSASTAAK